MSSMSCTGCLFLEFVRCGELLVWWDVEWTHLSTYGVRATIPAFSFFFSSLPASLRDGRGWPRVVDGRRHGALHHLPTLVVHAAHAGTAAAGPVVFFFAPALHARAVHDRRSVAVWHAAPHVGGRSVYVRSAAVGPGAVADDVVHAARGLLAARRRVVPLLRIVGLRRRGAAGRRPPGSRLVTARRRQLG